MDLPQAFLDRIQTQLGSEYEAFVASYAEPPSYGLRINPLKGAPAAIASELPFVLSPVTWTPEGYHADPAEHPGRHSLHEAGVYYIQDPSAMSVVSLLDPKPGESILDLCAAPGGKSTQIAGCMAGQGLLVSNEIIPTRARILSQNIERMGITNAIVCNEDPDHMAELFPQFFDKIVVDAPCSGEGMFRKDATAIREWSPGQVTMCASRQHMILSCAEQMLKPGGILVYSTCTFAPAEDEEQIRVFLAEHPDYVLEDWKEYLPNAIDAAKEGIQHGSLPGTMRLWPHKTRGEGHFVARLRKTGTPEDQSEISHRKLQKKQKKNNSRKQPDYSELSEWWKANLQQTISQPSPAQLQYFGEEIYQIPQDMRSLQGIRILRAGLHLGTRKKNRLEPAHALAKSLTPQNVNSHYGCSIEEATRYLHGETLQAVPSVRNSETAIQSLHGWTLICYEGYPLGWSKASQGILKNHYPKGLRIKF